MPHECVANRKAPGPWSDEPDYLKFTHAELACKMFRNPPTGTWCAYVNIPRLHPLYQKHYTRDDFPNFEVHGGVTFTSPSPDGNDWWIGFDCNHLSDFSPTLSRSNAEGATYKDIKHTEDQCRSLATQISAYQLRKEPTP